MPAHFKTLGPFLVCHTSAPLETPELKAFWSDVVGKEISAAIGVYILIVGDNKAMKPVYIGRAEKGFRARLKANHDAFRKIRNKYPNEVMSILFISRVTTKRGEFVRERVEDEKLKSIRDLEVLLIRDCLMRDIELINTTEKVFFENLVVPGYLHDKAVTQDTASRCLNKMIRAKRVKRS